MEIKKKKLNNKSPQKPMNKSIDKYKDFLGDKKDIKKSKDKKVLHVTRKRVSPKKIKKINNPKDLLHIENEISNMKSNIKMPTQNENLTSELNKVIKNPTVKPIKKPAVKPIKKPAVKPLKKPTVKPIKKSIEEPTVKPLKKPTVKPLKKPTVKPAKKSKLRSNSRNKKRSKKGNRRVSIKKSTFNNKDIKDVEAKIKEIRKKKTEDIKKELELSGVKVSGKSNKLVRDIYLYSKMCNINITHEK